MFIIFLTSRFIHTPMYDRVIKRMIISIRLEVFNIYYSMLECSTLMDTKLGCNAPKEFNRCYMVVGMLM